MAYKDTESPTLAVRKRRSKVMSYALRHPFYLFPDIYKAGITLNRKDLNGDIKALVKSKHLKQILFNKKYYFISSHKKYPYLTKIINSYEEMICTIKTELHIKNPLWKYEIKKQGKKINESTLGLLLSSYNYDLHKRDSIYEQILSKMLLIFLQKCKIMTAENKRRGDYLNELGNSIDMLDESDYIQYKLSDEQEIKALDEFHNFLNSFMLLLKLQNDFTTYLSIHPNAENFTKKLDQVFEDDQKYLKTFRSTRRIPLFQRIRIWNDLLISNDIGITAETYGFNSTKALRYALRPIQDRQGRPDMMKIYELFRMENNRMLISNVAIQEVGLLAVRYKLRDELKRCILENKEYKKLARMIKKELPGLLVI